GGFPGVGLDDSLPVAYATEAADPPRIAQQLALDAQAFLAVFVDDNPGPALAEFGIDVPVPQIERLEDVAIRVDHVVCARHRQSLRRQSNRCDINSSSASSRTPSRTHRPSALRVHSR